MPTEDVPTGNTFDKYNAKGIEGRLMGAFLDELDTMLPSDEPRRVLEVGAGEGEIARRLAARWPSTSIVLVDLPDVELAATWPAGVGGCFASIDALPFPDDTFDLVLAIEVLEHVDRPTHALRELARVSTAHVVLSVPHEPLWRIGNMLRGRYLTALGNTPGHVQHWTSRGFARTVSTALDVERVTTPFPWTMVRARSA